MIMMQQAFNDILLNVTQANDLISNETKSSTKSAFFDSNLMDNNNTTIGNNSTLTSSILKNNFFSNLVANDYLLDNKENYNLNDGTSSSINNIDKNIIKSSPLSSGLSSLSSSLSSSSSPASMFSNVTASSSSSLSRSSSTCSLLSSTIKQQQQEQHQQQSFKLNKSSTSSSPGLMNDLFLGNSMTPPPQLGSSVSSTNSSIENILPFSFNVGPIGCNMQSSVSPNLPKTSSELSSFSFGNTNNNNSMFNLNKKCTKYDSNKQMSGDFLSMGLENSVDWSLLNSNTDQTRYFQNKDDLQWIPKLNKEFCWNINKLTEIVLMNNSNNKQINESLINGALSASFLPSSCNINVNNNSSNFGMNNNNLNKMPRKIIGNHSLQMNNSIPTAPLNNGGQQQTSPNLQPHPSVINKFYSMNNQPVQQQHQQQQHNLMNLGHPIQNQQKLNNNLAYQQQNYNQQFNTNNNNNNNRIFGRIITNNRGYPQRIQC